MARLMNPFQLLSRSRSIQENLFRFCSSLSEATSEGCLSGITVLDMTRILAGPFCTMMLSDLGAEVIKVERPGKGDETRSWGPPFLNGHSAYYLSINRNKKSITIDFKKPEGLKIVRELAAKSDILVENYLPGKLEKLGLGFEDMRKVNQKLIYCSITGFGSSGPYAERAGFDVIAASMGGLLSTTGPENGEPCKVGTAISDLTTGLYAKGAILAALHQRSKTGVGMKIDCNLLSTTVSLLVNLGVNYLNTGAIPPRRGTAHETVVPYQSFPCEDNRYLTLCCGSDEMFIKTCDIIFPAEEAEQMISDGRFVNNAKRAENRKVLIELMTNAIRRRTVKEWLSEFEGSGVSYGPVNELDEVFSDPQVIHNKSMINVNHSSIGSLHLLGPAVKYTTTDSERISGIRKEMIAPPKLGQHTEMVLNKLLGYDSQKIEQLECSGVIKKNV